MLLKRFPPSSLMKNCCKMISYEQGQSPKPNMREYFYFVDHQGMLFLDDCRMKNFTSCFKDKKFLQFFFKVLQVNKTGRFEKEFPFFSPCGRERNYVRCDDLPIVFTHVLQTKDGADYLSYNHTGELLKVKFEPEKIYMYAKNGYVYHPGPEKSGGVGLIRSALAIQLSHNFIYEDKEKEGMPVYFMWKDSKHLLTNEVLEKLEKIKNV